MVWLDGHDGKEKYNGTDEINGKIDYYDTDGDGVSDKKEAGIPGVKVTMYKADSSFNVDESTGIVSGNITKYFDDTSSTWKKCETHTDENGWYYFKNVENVRSIIVFEYDGIKYKATKYLEGDDTQVRDKTIEYIKKRNDSVYDYSSKAIEYKNERKYFNNRYKEITNNSKYKYDYNNGVASIKTMKYWTNDGSNTRRYNNNR